MPAARAIFLVGSIRRWAGLVVVVVRVFVVMVCSSGPHRAKRPNRSSVEHGEGWASMGWGGIHTPGERGGDCQRRRRRRVAECPRTREATADGTGSATR